MPVQFPVLKRGKGVPEALAEAEEPGKSGKKEEKELMPSED
jgi:hypothetical protein